MYSGGCVLTSFSDCIGGGAYLGGYCTPTLCEQGACCRPDGQCTIDYVGECGSAGGTFVGGECTPGLCESIPTLRRSWGQIKSSYR